MKKANLIDMTEVLETAFKIKHHRTVRSKTDSDNELWNEVCDEVYEDAPDGTAFSECGSFDYSMQDVKECWGENPDSLFYKAVKKLMEKNKIKSITLVQE